MSVTYAKSFNTSQVVEGWRWEDVDDTSFLNWAIAQGLGANRQDFSLDRTNGPALMWQVYMYSYETGSYAPTGNYETMPLTTGVTYTKGYMNDPTPLIDVDTFLSGYWESDQYGRPYDLNDLLAPGTAPA